MIAMMAPYIGHGNGYDINHIILVHDMILSNVFYIISTRILEGVSTCCSRVMSRVRRACANMDLVHIGD